MKRYSGEIFWTKLEAGSGNYQGTSTAKINRAILNDNIFKIDHKNPNDLPDSEIRLKTTNGLKFDGSAKYINSPKSNALVNLEYYLNGKKVLLIGMWEEEKVEFMCIVILIEVNEFID